MSEQGGRNLHISGSGAIPGGTYDEITLSGSGRSDADIFCDKLHISGSGKFGANVHAGRCAVSGSCHVENDLETAELHVSGSVHAQRITTQDLRLSGSINVTGDILATQLDSSGSLHADGCIHGEKGRISGSLKVHDGVEFETLAISGVFHVGGLINAEKLDVELAAASEAAEIGGAKISVRSVASRLGFLARLFLPADGFLLTVHAIEGDQIDLVATTAAIVRGKHVAVGKGCRIERVEYSDSLEIAPDATVGESIKID